MQKVSYTGIILDSNSRENLRKEFNKRNIIPNGWEWIAHHMTIKMGELPEDVRDNLLGKKITLTIKSIANDDKVVAIGVSGFFSEKKIPHITLAVNQSEGGKPAMSDKLTNWTDCNVDFTLTGTIEEVPQPNSKKNLSESYNIKKLPFFNDVINLGGKIHQVGGAVRDIFLGKQSKDLDILISGIPSEELNNILKKYGKVDMVGASFGVIKFTPPGGEEIDIALPRTEKLNNLGGHKGFDVSADHTLPIEKDMERRDFTINSIAKDSDGNIIDPFGGVNDLGSKLIKLTNPGAFSDDPLRMLRAVQFASRFEFTIEPNTFKMIQNNAQTISEISKERILIEFDKIVHKGNPTIGAELLVSSGLYKNIFNTDFTGDFSHFGYVTRMSEFIYWLTECFTDQPDQYFKHEMKGEISTTKEISALAYLYNNLPGNDIIKQRWSYFNINKISPTMLNSHYVKSLLNDVIDDFKSGKYPLSLGKLAVNGNDMINMGFKDIEIGNALVKVIGAIFSDKILNDKNQIIGFLTNNKNTIMENNTKDIKKIIFFDFDATIMDSPMPEPGKGIYHQKKGVPYPHKGWWGRDESLDLDVFDIQPHSEIESQYRKYATDPNVKTVLLTNRIPQTANAIKKVLAKHKITFDVYSFKKDNKDKGQRIYDIMKNYFPDYKNFVFYDDDPKHLQSAHQNFIDEPEYNYEVYHVVNGKITN